MLELFGSFPLPSGEGNTENMFSNTDFNEFLEYFAFVFNEFSCFGSIVVKVWWKVGWKFHETFMQVSYDHES